MNNCTPLWHQADFAPHVRSYFASWNVEQMHAAVARSRLGSQKSKVLKTAGFGALLGMEVSQKAHAGAVQSTCRSGNAKNAAVSDRFWEFRCSKSACHCGAEHISKRKC